ncbi:MAG: thiamine pyrophosphate-dependent enzyme [Firmicutes bacterium]|nr:thiamine pyrophosphate-dependent enzyme [Bacillota bacterium]MDH7495433.1 thiamine pyrophosphate-dependent enzyme [Bacillota bacterium]
MSGNEAIARGAYEAGVGVACGYPGTPSTEIIERMKTFDGVYVEWSPNEKVAFEVALGAAIAGVRALVAMKHVGLNVAADPLFTAAYTGVNAGLVIVSADDPGMHSSQNEQDNRHYAKFAKIPMLEPSDSQEAKDFIGLALDISERFDTPVMLRTTTRVSHSSGIVLLGPPRARLRLAYKKAPPKYVMVPGNARLRRMEVEARQRAVAEFAESFSQNVIEWNGARVGIVASGVAYQYAREILGKNASYLKIAMTHPIPGGMVREFASRVERLYVVEELDPFLEEQIRAMGLTVTGKACLPATGELTPEIVRRALTEEGVLPGSMERAAESAEERAAEGAREGLREGAREGAGEGAGEGEAGNAPERAADRIALAPPAVSDEASMVESGETSEVVSVPARPPVMCPGCPHRGAFYVLKKMKTIATGDIGCYTLGASPPLSALDTTICMGASIGNAIGFSAAASVAGEPQAQATAGLTESGGLEPDGIRALASGHAPRKPVAVIGDSTFVHSGVTGLIDAVYNQAQIVVLIMDNGTTAMTGHQDHPATGVTARGSRTHKLSLEALSRACGVDLVAVIDPYDLASMERALRQAMDAPGPAVVIARRPCVLLPGAKPRRRYRVARERCNACRVCLGLGCPSIELCDGRPVIIEGSCVGCGVCAQICAHDAITLREAGEDRE